MPKLLFLCSIFAGLISFEGRAQAVGSICTNTCGMMVLTHFSGTTGQNVFQCQTIPSNPEGFVISLVDVRSLSGPTGQHLAAPRCNNAFADTNNQWRANNLGEVFGIAIGSRATKDIYVSATSIYPGDLQGPGGPGAIYKIDGTTLSLCTFVSFPDVGTVSLGNLCYDSGNDQIFASDLDNGWIRRVKGNGCAGIEQSKFDHGTTGRLNLGLSPIPDASIPNELTQAGRRVFGVQFYKNRLYYSVTESTGNSSVNQIWSVGIDSSGEFISTGADGPRIEIGFLNSVAHSSPTLWTPITDIAFSESGKMLVGERLLCQGDLSNLSSGAHNARTMEFQFDGTAWSFPLEFMVGNYSTSNALGKNATGGVDYNCSNFVFTTGDALTASSQHGQRIYGVQIFPPGVTTVDASYFIDVDGNISDFDKAFVGDLEITRCCLSLLCPPDKVVQCGTPWAFDSPEAQSGTCSTNLTLSFTTITNGTGCQQEITRTWTVADDCGNTNTCSQTITLLDNSPPLLICASNKTVQCGTTWEFDPPTVTDDCSGTNITLTILNTITNQTCPLQITRRWQAVDGCGNMSECSQTVSVAGSAPVTLSVSGQANIFGAGHTVPPNPGGGSAGIMPPGHTFPASAGQILKFVSVTGTASMTDCCASSGADGYFNIAPTDISSFEGISGIRHDGASYLVGVFFGPNQPTDPAPARLDFRSTGLGTTFNQFSPELGQTFFIGDGLTGTGSGATQQFIVPEGATRIFLGFADAPSYQGLPGAYQDNNGMLTATFEIEQPFFCSSDKIVACDAAWSFDPPTAGPCNGAAITNTVLSTVTNGLCPVTITRTWSVTDSCGHSNICSQTVTIAGPLRFFSGVYNNSSSSTYTSPSGNGQITATTLAGSGLSSIQNESALWSSRFTSLFPTANNNWATDAQTVRMIGAGNFTITIDLTQYNMSADLVFGFYNIRDQGTYTIAAYDVANAQIAPPFTWNFLGNDDDSLHPQASTHLALDPATGIFSTQFYQTGEHSDAAFWNQIPTNTAKIVITGALQQIANNQDGIAIYFAEPVCCPTNPPPLTIICPTNKTVECGTSWTFDLPVISSSCGPTNLSIVSTITNGTCPQVITRTWGVVDDCGGTNFCSQTVTIIDQERPSLECPKDFIVALNSNCQLEIPLIRPHALDNCTSADQLVYTQDPPAGTIVTNTCQTVTISVRDLCGNVTRCQVRVCAHDRTPPELECPKYVEVQNCQVPNVAPLLRPSDNCTLPNRLIITQTPAPGTPVAAGITTVTLTITDEAGNVATCVVPLEFGPNSFLTNLFNTGVGPARNTLANLAIDPHYTLGPVPSGTATGPGLYNPYDAIVGMSFLSLPSSASKWISPNGTATVFPNGFYTYTNKFVLPAGADPATVGISGRWDGGSGGKIYLNGSSTPAAVIPTAPFGGYWSSWHPFTLTGNFLPAPAENIVTFVVEKVGSYTAFRAEFTAANYNCQTCAPPVLNEKIPNRKVVSGSTTTFSLNLSGTGPFNIQWYRNGVPLVNGGHYSGVTTPTLTISPATVADAGIYQAVVSNSCGELRSNEAKLVIKKGWPWWWHWWIFHDHARPLSATYGSDLLLAGTDNFGINPGTALDFGLTSLVNHVGNVLHIGNGNSGVKLPLQHLEAGVKQENYSILADIHLQPSVQASTRLLSIFDRWGNLELKIVDGVAGAALTLNGMANDQSISLTSSRPPLFNAWNRIALVVRTPVTADVNGDGYSIVEVYLNGESVAEAKLDTVLSLDADSNIHVPGQSNESNAIYLSSLQFHGDALESHFMSEVGSPAVGALPSSPVGTGVPPLLIASSSTQKILISWSGDDFILQETSDFSGVWKESFQSFTQTENGDVLTTLSETSPSGGTTMKFYRLVYEPYR